MAKFKKPLLFALCLLPIAIIAGIFVGIYQLDTYPEEIIAQAVAELGSTELLIALGAVQTAGYALFCGFFGYILAEKTGLWKPIKFDKKSLVVTLAVSVAG
ncbi:MAG: CPBP family intramembrane metalloprotease, partial [Clostridia bacterium]|nr:CPBP family intramembrane metalloprotease [Clostridia bacterium]